MNRRHMLRVACAGGWISYPACLLFGASDFWNKKPASDWSVAEVQQLKTKSPWAKKVRGEMSSPMRAGSGGGGSRGARGGGALGTSGDSVSSIGGSADSAGEGGGGSRGGRGDMGASTGPSPVEGPEVVIRWENAKPLLDATKLVLPSALENHYAISVTGVPSEMIAALSRGRGREVPQPEAIVERIKAGATLTAKGKDPATADHLMQTMDRQTMIFGFSKDALPLAAADKEVLFTLKLVATFKAKFELKEMTYGGQLAI